MLALSTWLLFVAASVALAATPGPNLAYLVSRTLVQGRAAGLVSLAGTLTGLAMQVLAAAFGLSALLLAVPMAYDAVRFAGAVYLAFLAWQTWRSAGPLAASAMRARLAASGAWSRWSRRVLAGMFAVLAARLVLDRR